MWSSAFYGWGNEQCAPGQAAGRGWIRDLIFGSATALWGFITSQQRRQFCSISAWGSIEIVQELRMWMMVIRPLRLAQAKEERKFLSGLVLIASALPFFWLWCQLEGLTFFSLKPNFQFGHTSESKSRPETQGFCRLSMSIPTWRCL